MENQDEGLCWVPSGEQGDKSKGAHIAGMVRGRVIWSVETVGGSQLQDVSSSGWRLNWTMARSQILTTSAR